ncbi:MAG: glycosyltransferase family 2 protein [Acetobacter sp.]|uniref:glycosyltransferase family 2 protein n=1 Tax=Acetobacter sp. TaxID=440 RepID=UPI0039E96428
MMQRDETLLLEAWFRYYGYLFGFENLCVFDNNSTDPAVIETLKTYERAGADIHWGHNRPEDFLGRNEHFKNIIRHWDSGGNYDFVLPVDCDEFLSVFTEDGLSCSRKSIHSAFDALIGDKRAFEIKSMLFNVPTRPGYFRPEQHVRTFLAAGTLDNMDFGLQGCSSRISPDRRITDFTFIHMHNKPFGTLLQHTRYKLEKAVPLDNPKILAGYHGPEARLIRYLGMKEEDYLQQFDNGVFLRFQGLADLLIALGIADHYLTEGPSQTSDTTDGIDFIDVSKGKVTKTICFNPAAYLRLNADVRAARIMPLRHYISHGREEGRPFTEATSEDTLLKTALPNNADTPILTPKKPKPTKKTSPKGQTRLPRKKPATS